MTHASRQTGYPHIPNAPAREPQLGNPICRSVTAELDSGTAALSPAHPGRCSGQSHVCIAIAVGTAHARTHARMHARTHAVRLHAPRVAVRAERGRSTHAWQRRRAGEVGAPGSREHNKWERLEAESTISGSAWKQRARCGMVAPRRCTTPTPQWHHVQRTPTQTRKGVWPSAPRAHRAGESGTRGSTQAEEQECRVRRKPIGRTDWTLGVTRHAAMRRARRAKRPVKKRDCTPSASTNAAGSSRARSMHSTVKCACAACSGTRPAPKKSGRQHHATQATPERARLAAMQTEHAEGARSVT